MTLVPASDGRAFSDDGDERQRLSVTVSEIFVARQGWLPVADIDIKDFSPSTGMPWQLAHRMSAPEHDAGNIDDEGKRHRRRVGIVMLVVAAAVYIGLIIPPNIDRRFLIVSAAPCIIGIFCVMQSYQVISPSHLKPQTPFKSFPSQTPTPC